MPLLDLADARARDAADRLAAWRAEFVFDDPDLIYLDGNSLGRLPRRARTLAHDLIDRQWGERLIRGWNEGWFELPERIGAKIAALIGADPDEVIVCDSTSINLFKLAVAALQSQPERRTIISDDLNFPSDLYILQGIQQLLGQRHEVLTVASPDGIDGPVAALKAALSSDTALLTLSHTVFKSGFVYDMADLTAAAQAVGALTLWDLSHSVGAVPVDLHACGADLAIGCCYKYLNGGPGAPAFLYVRRDLQARLFNPLSGWMGQRDLFAFGLAYQPAEGLRRFAVGTPPIISLALIEAGVDLLAEAGMAALRAKSVAQTEYLIALFDQMLLPLGFSLKSPRAAAQRGSHVSLGHEEALGIDLALIAECKVLPDFRTPDNIRLGIAPIYTTYEEIFRAVVHTAELVQTGRHLPYLDHTPTVT